MKIQLWMAISVYVLVTIYKREIKLKRSLSEILQILSLTLFEKDAIYQVLPAVDPQSEACDPCNQLKLFDL